MSNLLTVEGPLYRGCVWVYRVMILTFLWLLFNCLIVTIGPSTIALFNVSSKLVRGDDVHLFSHFFKSFKKNFISGLMLSVFIYVIGLNLFLCFNSFLLNISVSLINSLIYLFLIIEMAILLLYVFPIISRYETSLFNALKNSFFIGNTHLFTSLTGCMLLLLFAFFYLISPLWFMVLGCGMFALIWSWMIKRVLNLYDHNVNFNNLNV